MYMCVWCVCACVRACANVYMHGRFYELVSIYNITGKCFMGYTGELIDGFFSPMSTTSCGNVFIGDLIQYQSSGSSCMGCVVQFICQVG